MLALQAPCSFEAVGGDFPAQLREFLADEQVLRDLNIPVPLPADLAEFASVLAEGVWRRREWLDAQLSQTAVHWSLARMTPVDRNVLRLGLYELLECPATPPQVAINEAIELARLFGDADSPAFVNGVLDAIRRRFRAQAGES